MAAKRQANPLRMIGRKIIADKLKLMACSYFSHMKYGCFTEVGLSSWGKLRADFVALKISGDIVICEIKSGAADFRNDTKWSNYLPYCNRLYFVFPYPMDVDLPPEVGVLVPGNNGYLRVAKKATRRVIEGRNRRDLVLRLAWRAATYSKRTNPRRVRIYLTPVEKEKDESATATNQRPGSRSKNVSGPLSW